MLNVNMLIYDVGIRPDRSIIPLCSITLLISEHDPEESRLICLSERADPVQTWLSVLKVTGASLGAAAGL